MPRGPAPAWRARKPPITDEYILAAVDKAGGPGKHDGQGHYATLIIRGLADRDEAAEWKRSLFRCAHYMARNGIAAVSISQADIDRDGTGYKITFRVSDKTMARKHQLQAHGTDRSKWSYDPRKRGFDG